MVWAVFAVEDARRSHDAIGGLRYHIRINIPVAAEFLASMSPVFGRMTALEILRVMGTFV
jgi:hypothetical protein